MCTCVNVYASVCVRVCTCTRVYVYAYVCVYVCEWNNLEALCSCASCTGSGTTGHWSISGGDSWSFARSMAMGQGERDIVM